MNQIYRHSDKFAPGGLVAGVAAGMAVGFPVAYIYAWGTIKIEEQKLAALATAAFGVAIGLAAAFAMRQGKVRNAKLAGAIAILPAAAALYWSWAFWVRNIVAIFQEDDLDPFALMKRPQALWNLMKLINEQGTWSGASGSPTKGTELWILWVAEAVGILACAALSANALIEWQPFCEKCQLWCSKTEKLSIASGDAAYIKRSLVARDLSFLEKLGPGNAKTNFITAQLQSCPNCGDLNTLTLTQTLLPQTTKWYQRRSFRKVELVKKFMLSHPEADSFRNTAHNVKQLTRAAKV
jgi:hypothetical protein